MNRGTKRRRGNQHPGDQERQGRKNAFGQKGSGFRSKSRLESKVDAMLGKMTQTKYVDDAFRGYGNVVGTGEVRLLNGIAQGADQSERIGKHTKMKSIQIRGVISPGVAATLPCQCGYMIIYDKQPGALAPTVGEILDTASPFSFMKDINSSRFQIMRRRLFSVHGLKDAENIISGTHDRVGGRKTYVVDDYVKINRDTVFKGATAGVVDISVGALYIVTVGDQNATNAADMDFGVRCRYIDFNS